MDWHLIADITAGDVDHYIGYYSAMQVHGLITQPSLTEQFVVSQQSSKDKDAVFRIVGH
jgi:hypothetical protein